jgi:lysophospholipase L1-like esterase
MRQLLTAVCALLIGVTASCQAPFREEIEAFKQQDITSIPPQNANLFVGSSSFRLWKDLSKDFPGFKIINRGFGGSTFTDLLRYVNDVVISYRPKQVFIYCGENDLAKGVSPEQVFRQFKEFVTIVQQAVPGTRIIFVSIKPSPSRAHIKAEVLATNTMIKDYLAMQNNAIFIDVYRLMLNANGSPREELFVEDRLHMNRKGYDIWKAALAPYLK